MIPSPNIWNAPEVYEVENLASDRVGVIEAAIDALHPIAGATVLDIGCGTGFHLPGFARRGARVLGVEPHRALSAAAHDRVGRLPASPSASRPAVLTAAAEALPVGDASIDIVHARWAYFFGAGCEPGLAEVARVLRPGGVACLIDNDTSRSTFGRWFREAYPAYDGFAVQRFWDRRGYTTLPLTIEWTFERRSDLEAVIGIEFPPAAAERILTSHEGLTVDYAVALRWRRFP